jgi:hypothetical protein
MSAAISRQREFLADATAVQLTRNPSGIANALKKIGGFQHGAIIKTSRAESMAHFFLANSQRPSFFSALYASHPPLAERISRIDPSFTGEFPESNGIELQSGYEGVQISGFHSSSTLSNQTPSQQGEEGSGSASSTRASEWMPPTELRSSFIGLGTAESAVLAVLMDKDPRERKVQSQIIAAFTSPEGVETKRQELCDLSVNQRLSVVMMAMPSIHGEAHQYRKAFRETVSQLIRVDEHVTRLEFLVGTLVEFASDDSAPSDSLWRLSSGPSEAELIQYIEVLLSVCASFTSQDPNECSILVAEASARLGVPCTYQQAAADDIPGFLRAVSWLREASGEIRRQLVASFDGIMRRDGTITELERALSRTFAMLLKAEALYRL